MCKKDEQLHQQGVILLKLNVKQREREAPRRTWIKAIRKYMMSNGLTNKWVYYFSIRVKALANCNVI